MADANESTTAAAGTQPPQGQAPSGQPQAAPDTAKMQAELAALRKEAAGYRVKAKEAEEKASREAEEKAKATGDWKTLLEQREAALANAAKRLAELEPYEGTVKAEVAALKQRLGDRAAVVDGLSDAHALRILKQFDALAAGPGAAKPTTSASPAGVTGTPDLSRMTPEQAREAFKKMTPEQKAAVYAANGITPPRTPFGWGK